MANGRFDERAPRFGWSGGTRAWLAVIALLLAASGADAIEPFELDRVDAPCCPVDLARVGDHLVVAYDDPDDLVGLRVYDYLDPTAPQLVAVVPLDVVPKSISSSWWGYIYVAAGTDGLRIVDVSSPASPVVVGSVPIGGDAFRVEVRGFYAYVGTRVDGLHVFDLAVPASPLQVGLFGDDGRQLIDFDVRANQVGLCDKPVGASPRIWRVVSFADPSAPVVVAYNAGWEPPFVYSCSRVTTDGGDFFFEGPWYYHQPSQGGDFNVHALMRAPFGAYATPAIIGGFALYRPLDGLAADGGYVYALSGGDLDVFDEQGGIVASVNGPFPGSSPGPTFAPSETAWTRSRPYEMWAEEGLLFATAGPAGVAAWDVSDPTDPILLSELRPDGDLARHVEVTGDTVVVSDEILGLRIFDASKPWALEEVASLPQLGGPLAVAGGLVYVGSSDPWGLQILDVSTPASPVLLGFVATPPGVFRDLAIDGSTLVAIVAGGDVHIFDVSNSLAPAEIGVHTSGSWSRLDVQGALVALSWPSPYDPWYVPYGEAVLLDISTPAAPVEVGQLLSDDWPGPVKLAGDHAFVFTSGRMYVFDVTTPSSPVEVASLAVSNKTWVGDGDPELHGDLLLVPKESSGVTAIDVSDPTMPVIAAHWLTGAPVEALAVGDGVLFTAESIDGVASYALDASAVPAVSWPMLVALSAMIGAGARRALRGH